MTRSRQDDIWEVLDTNVLSPAVISTGVPHDIVVADYGGEFQLRSFGCEREFRGVE